MTTEYRVLTPDEARVRSYNGRLGFGDSTADAAIDRALARNWLQTDWVIGAFDNGELASQVATAPFTIRWNGRDIGCGGVTAVSTLPTHRRRGHLRELMRRSFERMRGDNQPLAMLWASMAAIYQRFGYGIVYTQHVYDFDPRHLRFVDDIPIPGRTRLLKGEPATVKDEVAPVYERFAAPRTLMVDRTPWWDRYRRSDADAPPWLVLAYEEAGEVLGYAVYEIKHQQRSAPGPYQQVHVIEFVWNTPAAHRALVTTLAGYDLAYSVQIENLPSDDPLFFQAQEPRLLNARAMDGTLLRVVDIVPALEGRGYDSGGRLRFSLSDDLCPWNSGTWELTVEEGAARLVTSTAEPDVCLTPRTLAILASGYQSATTLARIGLIPAADARELQTADDLFRTAYAPYCADHF